MKPIFPVNLCKLVDRLFTEFENADCIKIHSHSYLTIYIKKQDQHLADLRLYKGPYIEDSTPNAMYTASKTKKGIEYSMDGTSAVNGLELEKSMKKLRAVVHCCQKGGKVLLNIDDKLLETLKVLDSVF
jgi:hypothetical protein